MRVGRRWALLALAVGQLTFVDVGQVVRRTLVRLHAEPAPESKKAEVGPDELSKHLAWPEMVEE